MLSPIRLLICVSFFLILSVQRAALAGNIANSAAVLKALLQTSQRVKIEDFQYNITTITTEAESKKLSSEVVAIDPNCTNPITRDPRLALELSRFVAGPPLVKVFEELRQSGELVMILANDAQTRRACKVKRYKIYLLNGSGIAVNVF